MSGSRTRAAGKTAPAGSAGGRRLAALRSARVWAAPGVPPGKVDFTANTPGPGTFDAAADVDCEFVLKEVGGTTPKFDCRWPAATWSR